MSNPCSILGSLSSSSWRAPALPRGALTKILASRSPEKATAVPITVSRCPGVILFSSHIPSVKVGNLVEGFQDDGGNVAAYSASRVKPSQLKPRLFYEIVLT